MNPGSSLLFLVLFGVGLVAVIIFNFQLERRRREEMSALAARLGFRFRPDADFGFVQGWSFLGKLSVGSDRYAFNLMEGGDQGRRTFVFDYHYKTGSGKQTHHYYLTVFILILPVAFPKVTVGPEGVFSKIAQTFGYEDIDFESAEFSRAFCVRSANRKFAYDVCNPRLIEFLLANRDLEFEIQGPALALAFDGKLPAPQIETNLQRLWEIRSRLPDYLFAAT